MDLQFKSHSNTIQIAFKLKYTGTESSYPIHISIFVIQSTAGDVLPIHAGLYVQLWAFNITPFGFYTHKKIPDKHRRVIRNLTYLVISWTELHQMKYPTMESSESAM